MKNRNHWTHMQLMFSSLVFLIMMGFSFSRSFAQLVVNTAVTPVQMVQNTLLGGGVTVSNITYTGGASSRGSFSNGNTTNLGLNSGIILCTGFASQIPNPVTFFMNTNLGLPGDPQLNALTNGGTSFDASVLEFDFVPMSDTVRFRYVFGSEEYPNYVCSHFNDVFGFFISGANPSGGNYTNHNIALIPGTALPVAINTVNNGTPGSGYSSANCLSLSYSNYYVDNVALGGTTIAFGGFTTPLTAWCHVVPCQTYHVKLAVGDIFNGLFDSGVFLEANSFSSNAPTVAVSYSNPALGNFAVEGCSSGYFSFTLPNPASSPVVINYTVSGSATPGVDYPALPGSITIPAGQDSAVVAVTPIMDNIPEGTETVIISFTSGCGTITDTIYIADNTTLTVNTGNDTSICSGSSLAIVAAATGGIPAYSYLWNNGAGAASQVTVTPSSNTVYVVTVTDQCAHTATADIAVNLQTISVSITPAEPLCGQANGSATANATGPCIPGFSYVWNTSPPQTSITASGLAAGSYTVTVSCGACTSSATTTLTSSGGPVISVVSNNAAGCGASNGSAQVNTNGGMPPYHYIWSSIPAQSGPSLQNVPAGNYTVTVTDSNSCTGTLQLTIAQASGPSISIITVNAFCGNNDGSATATVTGGSGNYTYLWSTNPQQTGMTATGLSSGNYTVTVTDGSCNETASCNIINNNSLDATIMATPTTLTLMDGPVNFTGYALGNIVEWKWNFGDGSGFFSGQLQNHSYDNLGSYTVTLTVVNASGCTATATIVIEVREPFAVFIPNAFTPNEDQLNDLWYISGTGVDKSHYELYIYDRWGGIVFHSTQWGEGWNGNINNKRNFNKLVMGVYAYIIRLNDLDGKKHVYIGSITLVI